LHSNPLTILTAGGSRIAQSLPHDTEVQLARRSQRNRRPAAQQRADTQQRPAGQQRAGAQRDTARPGGSPATPDRYEKYLPAWMKGANGARAGGAPAQRPSRPRRARPPRPAGGYTPGKFANNGDLLS
jgi:hypothetical protein